MSRANYIQAAHRFNRVAPSLRLKELPFDLPRYIARDPEHLRDLLGTIEQAVRALEGVLGDMRHAWDGIEVSSEGVRQCVDTEHAGRGRTGPPQ